MYGCIGARVGVRVGSMFVFVSGVVLVLVSGLGLGLVFVLVLGLGTGVRVMVGAHVCGRVRVGARDGVRVRLVLVFLQGYDW